MSVSAKSKKEEEYARERIENSPLKVRRENAYDLCQCGHVRAHHSSKCLSPLCFCDGFKPV